MEQDTQKQLKEYRDSIDNIDAALVFLLSERFKITHKVGVLKSENTLLPADKSREAQQVSRLRKLSKEADLDPEFTEKMLNFIIAEVISNHDLEVGDRRSVIENGTLPPCLLYTSPRPRDATRSGMPSSA